MQLIKRVRYGSALPGVKGVGDKAVESIIEERKERGPYKSVYDFAQRSNTRSVNRKSYENLVYGGGFDEFGLNRARFFAKTDNGVLTGIERLIKYANDYQNVQSSSQSSLFGGGAVNSYIPEPAMPEADEWPLIEKLKYEKEVIGMYLTGHPLDNYRFDLEAFCNTTTDELKVMQKMRTGEITGDDAAAFDSLKRKGDIRVGGIVSAVHDKTMKNGDPFITFVLEDYKDSYEFALFRDDYLKFRNSFTEGYLLQIKCLLEKRRGQEKWDLKICAVEFLSGLRQKLTKSLTVQLQLNSLNNDLLNSIYDVVNVNSEKYPEKNCILRFKIMDEAMLVELVSKGYKIYPSDDLMTNIFNLTHTQPVLS